MLQTLKGVILPSGKNENVLKQATQILLKNIPRTATPADIRRVINKAGVRGVHEIAIDYEYFKPRERAILTLVSPDYLQTNLQALSNLSISGISLEAQSYESNSQQQKRPRMRGHKGRLEAAQRGVLTGEGPRAGIANNELTVIMGGLPARTSVEHMAEVLKNFKLAQSKGVPQIVKLPLPSNQFSLTSKFLITMASLTEAHRFVRKLHASYIKLYGEDIPVTAKLIN